MSIGLILDEKPEWCEDCIAHKEPYDLCGMVGKRNPHEWLPDWCPLQEVELVRHGHWKALRGDWDGLYECQECGSRFGTPYYYCPVCGVKMDCVDGGAT